MNIFESLGIIGILIVIVFLLAIFLFLERLSFINLISINASSFIDGILNLLNSNKELEVITLCEESTSPISTIIRSCLLHKNDNILNIEQSINALASLEITNLNKRIYIFNYLSILPSLLGLLGTLLSIYNHLNILIIKDVVLDPNLLISFFLYSINSTILGCFVTIIVFSLSSYLKYRVSIITNDMQWCTHKIFDYYSIKSI